METIATALQLREAHTRVAPYVHRTAMMSCKSLSEIAGCEVIFKCENFQKTGSFKARGATHAILQIKGGTDQVVATHSSGNHAAALAWAARIHGRKAHIVMPDNSSRVKVESVKRYGGEITFCQPTLADREYTLSQIIQQGGAIEIHPYDNQDVIAGQSGVALEILEDAPDVGCIIAPVGGGGLLSGTCLSSAYLSPGTMVFGAEPQGADDAKRSLMAGKIIPSVFPTTLADGLRTSLSSRTFPIIHKHVNDILTMDDAAIVHAMRMLWMHMKIIVEPSSAIVLAALLANKDLFKGQKVALILSGGNLDPDNLPWQQARP